MSQTPSGSRRSPNGAGDHPSVGLATFADAAAVAEIVINASAGAAGPTALEAAEAANLDCKILMDVSNPLDFSRGMPPSLTLCNDDSLGEQIQRAFPNTKVVKTLNTVNAYLMVNPGQLKGADHTMFVAGNDAGAKAAVSGYLEKWFGWKDVMDLGDISNARGTEMLLPLWARIDASTNNPMFAFKVVRRGGVRRRTPRPSLPLLSSLHGILHSLGCCDDRLQLQRPMTDDGITCSMSRLGNVWDNAAMERFFSSVKTERTARKAYRTRDNARADVLMCSTTSSASTIHAVDTRHWAISVP